MEHLFLEDPGNRGLPGYLWKLTNLRPYRSEEQEGVHMTITEAFEKITAGEAAGWALAVFCVLLSLIQVSPLKLNPWDSIFGWKTVVPSKHSRSRGWAFVPSPGRLAVLRPLLRTNCTAEHRLVRAPREKHRVTPRSWENPSIEPIDRLYHFQHS